MNAAEDVVQDVFCKMGRTRERLSLTGSLKGYLITCTVNRIRNLHRDRARHAEQPLEKAEACCSVQRSPDQWAMVSEQLECLRAAMGQLPYEQREVLMLRMHSDLTFRQIARIQETSVSTVQGRYRYGIDKLRSLLNGELV
jgi:RNA polymerase sigma-70 factor (ECF subfamily)